MNFAQFLPIAQQIGNYLKVAADHYAALKVAGKEAGPDVVAMFLRVKLDSWDPKVNNKSVLDSPTRDAAARFLAGVAVNLTE